MPSTLVLGHQHGYHGHHGEGLRPISRRTGANVRIFASSQQVRRKFFQKIGVGATTCGVNQRPRNLTPVRDLRRAPRFDVPLQYDREEERRREKRRQLLQILQPSSADATDDDESSTKSSSSTVSSTSSTQKRQVGFRETVTVVPIPMRTEYSSRVRAKLFTNSVEMCENVERNLLEFAAEDNGNWRAVRLEDEMYHCGVTGKLLHPVHVETNAYVFGSPTDYNARSPSTGGGFGKGRTRERRSYWI